jgi:hypothetical protein
VILFEGELHIYSSSNIDSILTKYHNYGVPTQEISCPSPLRLLTQAIPLTFFSICSEGNFESYANCDRETLRPGQSSSTKAGTLRHKRYRSPCPNCGCKAFLGHSGVMVNGQKRKRSRTAHGNFDASKSFSSAKANTSNNHTTGLGARASMPPPSGLLQRRKGFVLSSVSLPANNSSAYDSKFYPEHGQNDQVSALQSATKHPLPWSSNPTLRTPSSALMQAPLSARSTQTSRGMGTPSLILFLFS